MAELSRVHRDWAIVDLLKTSPDLVGYTALRRLSEAVRSDLYESLTELDQLLRERAS